MNEDGFRKIWLLKSKVSFFNSLQLLLQKKFWLLGNFAWMKAVTFENLDFLTFCIKLCPQKQGGVPSWVTAYHICVLNLLPKQTNKKFWPPLFKWLLMLFRVTHYKYLLQHSSGPWKEQIISLKNFFDWIIEWWVIGISNALLFARQC